MQIADFYQYVSPELPGCPDETLRRAIVQSVQTLCRKAHIWRELQDPIQLVDGVREYEPDVPAGARIVNIEEVFCGSSHLEAVTLGAIKWKMPDWQTAEGSEPVYYMGANDWGVINVYPLPKDPAAELTLRAEFEPLMGATVLPDFILQRYQEVIEMGVKARCMIMPKVTWSDPATGEYWRARFDSAASDAAIKMLHERNSGSIRVQPRRFG